MASRYPTTKVLDYCLHPVRLVVDTDVVYVPCGKCDGCLLHKANEWSMRLGSEIEDNQLAIFFTLTYSNKYLPTFVFHGLDIDHVSPQKVFTCYHERNIRCTRKPDGSFIDVVRKEDFPILSVPMSFHGISATNYKCDKEYFPYSSKRDFQLYLKLLRKDLYEHNNKGYFSETKEAEKLRFRYYAISEYGETLLRPHIHSVILPNDSEIAEYLCYEGLFKNWKMCRQDYFQQFCHFADSGCRGYITQYLTMSARLPQIYHEDRIKPWRLSSKGKAIGFNGYDEKEVFENIIIGVDEYCKSISRLDARHILRYPKGFGSRLFPKCFEYRKKDFHGLYRIYSVLWFFERCPRWCGSTYLVDRLCEAINPADVSAAKTCQRICNLMNIHPFTYVYALDMYWYTQSMAALKIWYQWQEIQSDPYEIIKSYNNFVEYVEAFKKNVLSEQSRFVLEYFLDGFGLNWFDVIFKDSSSFVKLTNQDYACEVSDILTDMVKMPKFNEKYGLSPNSVY